MFEASVFFNVVLVAVALYLQTEVKLLRSDKAFQSMIIRTWEETFKRFKSQGKIVSK